MKRVLLSLLLLALAAPARASDLYFGADLSFANQMDDCGAVYRENGKPVDVYRLFKAHGADVARIRLWNDPRWTKYSNLGDVARSIRRAKAAGMQVLLDFHYSDTWADGGKQLIPAAWAKITDPQKLADALYQYTFDTLMALDKAGLMPDIVQVGNEINHEMLMTAPWRHGPIDWRRNALLINAGIRAVHDAGARAGKPLKTMIQIAQPENVPGWFEQAVAAGVTGFDLIGISYYPKWSNYSLAGLGGTINLLRNRYPHVGVMVVETAYPWTLGRPDNPGYATARDNLMPGYPATPEGQAKFLTDLSQIVIANGGVGVLDWAPDWIAASCRKSHVSGADWPNMTFFDAGDEVLPAIDYMRHAYAMPVPVTFRFADPAPGHPFYLWGDFLGARDFASVPLEEEGGMLTFRTTLMPGTLVHYQVFGAPDLPRPLLEGGEAKNQDLVAGTVPQDGAVFGGTVAKP